MSKSSKLTKATIIFLFFVPFVFCAIAIVQTFVLKNRQAQLSDAQTKLEQVQSEKETLEGIENYVKSDQYIQDYNNHHGKTDDGDIKVTPK